MQEDERNWELKKAEREL